MYKKKTMAGKNLDMDCTSLSNNDRGQGEKSNYVID